VQIRNPVNGIWLSKRQGGVWQEPTLVWLQNPGLLALNGCPFVQGDEMIFCTARQGYSGLNWFRATYYDGEWRDWGLIAFDSAMRVGELHIHGDTLYYHSDREGGAGGLDLWTATRAGNGDWRNPVNLAPVNTASDDSRPYVTPDGNELWFTRTYEGTPAIFRSRRVAGQCPGPQDPTGPPLTSNPLTHYSGLDQPDPHLPQSSPKAEEPPSPFLRPNPPPSLRSRRSASLLSTPGATGARTSQPHSSEGAVVHTTSQATGRPPCPALSATPARGHHASPHRSGARGDLSRPGPRGGSNGGGRARFRREGVQELPEVRDLGPRVRQGSMRILRLRLPRGLLLQGPGSLPLMQCQSEGFILHLVTSLECEFSGSRCDSGPCGCAFSAGLPQAARKGTRSWSCRDRRSGALQRARS